MKVSATLKGVPDSLGRRTVYIRKSDGYKRTFQATQIKIEPKYWKRKVVGHPQAKRLNEEIRQHILRMETRVDRPYQNFNHYALSLIGKWETLKKFSTIKSLQSKIKIFKEYFDGDINKIKVSTLEGFAEFCYSRGNETNTVWSSLKAIRTIIYEAHKQKVIQDNPFTLFSMPKYKDPEKTFLTKEQVGEIEEFLKTTKDYKVVTAWFLISCYTGLRYGDQAAFNKGKIKDGRLIIYTAKTGKPVSIKLNPKLKELFSIVNYKPVPYSNAHYNRLIKVVAAACELPDISVHTARHTFGTLCASAGISQEVTAKLLGHSSIRTTAIYYQITGDRVDTEFDKLF